MDNIKLSKRLTDLARLDVDIDLKDLKMQPKYTKEIDDILDKLEFKNNTKDKLRKAIKLYE
jgi:arginyl-tRNA synthetase